MPEQRFHYTIEPPESFSLTLNEDGGLGNFFFSICVIDKLVVRKRHNSCLQETK